MQIFFVHDPDMRKLIMQDAPAVVEMIFIDDDRRWESRSYSVEKVEMVRRRSGSLVFDPTDGKWTLRLYRQKLRYEFKAKLPEQYKQMLDAMREAKSIADVLATPRASRKLKPLRT